VSALRFQGIAQTAPRKIKEFCMECVGPTTCERNSTQRQRTTYINPLTNHASQNSTTTVSQHVCVSPTAFFEQNHRPTAVPMPSRACLFRLQSRRTAPPIPSGLSPAHPQIIAMPRFPLEPSNGHRYSTHAYTTRLALSSLCQEGQCGSRIAAVTSTIRRPAWLLPKGRGKRLATCRPAYF